jgi:uncharacterized membrane protein YcaP (DUF421 family)
MEQSLTIIVRAIIGFFTLLIFTRVLGKQQVSQLTYFDYILGITIGSIAGILTTDLNSRAWLVWLGIATWVALSLLMKSITLKSRKASKYIDGEATIVIMNGKIMEHNLRQMSFRATDLLEMLRIKGIFNPSHVEFALLETNGKLSVLRKSQYRKVTPNDLQLNTDYEGLSIELIYDGTIIRQNLKQVNLDQNWLKNKLEQADIYEISKVFLATLDTSGTLYIDTKEDTVKIPIEIRDYSQMT